MIHPTDDQLYELARKLHSTEELTREENELVRHSADCDACYSMLSCLYTMLGAEEHLAEHAKPIPAHLLNGPILNTPAAVLRLAVDQLSTVLEQTGTQDWSFRKAPSLAGLRSGGRKSGATQKLTDPDNANTFVAYDQSKAVLLIQVDSADCVGAPRGSVTLPDGKCRELVFATRENVFQAQLTDLPQGEYTLTLEKDTEV